MNAPGRVVCALAQGAACVIGLNFAVAPVLIGLSAAFLVRAPFIKLSSDKVVMEISLTMLAMLGTFVTIADHNTGPGNAFWCGIGFGSLGSGMIEIGKSVAIDALKSRAQAAVKVLFGIGGNGP
jgi:hypothetical protein